MAVATAVVAVVGAIAQGIKAQNVAEANEKQQKLNNAAVSKATLDSYDDLSASERDVLEDTALQGIDQQKQAMQAEGQINVLAGASGTAGGSVSSMLSDVKQTKGKNLSTIQGNRTTELDNIKTQAEQIRQGGAGRMGNRTFDKPSTGMILANSAMAGASAYAGAGGSFGVGGD